MKRPAFQFYPADWRKDAALQSCSLAAQGLWINALCIAHECEPYGHLTINGQPMTPAQLGRLVGASAKEAAALVDELVVAGVASKTDGGALYSRRMVRDEDLRTRRAEGGKAGSEHGAKGAEHGSKGGRPPKGRGVSEPPLEPPPSSSSSSSINKPPTPDGVAPPVERPPEVAEAHWRGWLAVRKAKRGGPVTETALDGVRREAAKAGITLDDAVRISAERSWVGFRADWEWRPSGAPGVAQLTPAAARGASLMARFGGQLPQPSDDPRTIDVELLEAHAPRLAAGRG